MTGFRSCCGYPHGASSMYAMILGISSYLLAISSSWGCYFATVDFIWIDESSTKFSNAGRMGLGLFSFEDKIAASDLTCKLYSEEQLESMDSIFKAARAIAISANIFIGIGMISLVCLSCITVQKTMINKIGAVLFIGGVLEGLSFLLFASKTVCRDADCQFFFGAGLALLCTVVTILNAIVTYRIPEIHGDYDDDDDDGEVDNDGKVGYAKRNLEDNDGRNGHKNDDDNVSVNTEEQANDVRKVYEHTLISDTGKRHIIKTIVNQDGTRTIEETTVAK